MRNSPILSLSNGETSATNGHTTAGNEIETDLGSNQKTACSSPYSTTSTSPTAGLESDSGASSSKVPLSSTTKHGKTMDNRGDPVFSTYASSHEIDSDSGIGSCKEGGGLNPSSNSPNGDVENFYKLRLAHENGFKNADRDTPTSLGFNVNTFGNDCTAIAPSLTTSFYGSSQSKTASTGNYGFSDDLDEVKRSYEKKLRDKDTTISDMRDEHRREMVKLRQRHEQERIELTAYGEEQKRLYSESQTSAKEVKRELQDKKWTLEMIQSDITANKDQASLVQRRMDMVQKELNMALDDRDRLVKIKKDLENDLYDAASEAADLKSARQAIMSAQTSLKNDFLNLQEDLLSKDETIAGLEDRISKLQVDISRLVKDKDSQELEIDEKDKQISALKRQVESCNQKIREQDMGIHSANHYKKQLSDIENRTREMEEEFYMKENKYKEKLEELEYELDILQNNTRLTNDTTLQENSDLKRKNQMLEDKLEEAKKKAFQTELKLQEAETQFKMAQRQIRKLEDKLESVEINYNALLKRGRGGNYGRTSANPQTMGYSQGPINGYAAGREYYDVMSASAIVNDSYDATSSEYGWPRVNRASGYGRRNVRSVTPMYDAPEQYMYGYDQGPQYSTDDLAYNGNTKLGTNEGWDESPPSHFRAPRHYEDDIYHEDVQTRQTNSRKHTIVDTYLDEYGFERPILKNNKKEPALKHKTNGIADLQSTTLTNNTPTPGRESEKENEGGASDIQQSTGV